MTLTQAVARPMRGIFDLCRFRPEGLARFDFSWQGFWQSWAALPFATAPFVIKSNILSALATSQGSRSISVWDAIGTFSATWMAYTILFLLVTRWLALRTNVLATLMVLNWFHLFSQCAAMVLVALAGLGLLAPSLFGFLVLGLFFYLASVQVFILRTALGATMLQAIGFVVLDELVQQLLHRGFGVLLS